MGSALCVITARGGSKRIPRKNIRDFCGKPIIAYSIEAALESGSFDEVMVSTDDAEIADVSRRFGAQVPFMRSAANSDDHANTNDVVSEVLSELAGRGLNCDIVCCLYPTAPFVTAETLRGALRALEDDPRAQSLMPVARYSFPPQRGMVVEGHALAYAFPEFADARSQDLPSMYHDAGQFYLCRTAAFLEAGRLAAPPTVPFVLPGERVQDIDTPEDWRLAELKYAMLEARGHCD